MSVKNNIASTLFGCLFSLAILFPGFVKFTHLFEDHAHVACSNSKQHIHEKKFDCEINDFHINSCDIPDFEYNYSTTPKAYHKEAIPYFSSFTSEIEHGFLRRGPPSFS
jgi:hypothetical protein